VLITVEVETQVVFAKWQGSGCGLTSKDVDQSYLSRVRQVLAIHWFGHLLEHCHVKVLDVCHPTLHELGCLKHVICHLELLFENVWTLLRLYLLKQFCSFR
jgi:hypothetical protein